MKREDTALGSTRELMIIGEALNQLLLHFPETNARIDSARSIVNFRNLLIHEYGEVDDKIVWSIVIASIPRLKAEIQDWIDTP